MSTRSLQPPESLARVHAPVVALRNGYYLQPDAKGHTELVKRNGRRILPGPIAAYAVSRQIVTGAVVSPRFRGRERIQGVRRLEHALIDPVRFRALMRRKRA